MLVPATGDEGTQAVTSPPKPSFRDRAMNLDTEEPDPTDLTDLLVDMANALDKLVETAESKALLRKVTRP